MEFMQRITLENIFILKSFFEKYPHLLCDYSIGVKWMWKDYFNTRFVIIKETLILIENYEGEKYCFYYPIGPNLDEAFAYIEKVAKHLNLSEDHPVKFCCVSDDELALLKKRYPDLLSFHERKWADYLYNYSDLSQFAGGKYSGQRNHVNKFKSLYPNHVCEYVTEDQIGELLEFFDDNVYRFDKGTEESTYENIKVRQLIIDGFKLGLIYGCMRVDGKIVSFTIVEIIDDVVYIHVEKANRDYIGVYPSMVQAFEQLLGRDKSLKYINRMEDCNDLGLRTSKTQYHPAAILNKHFVCVGSMLKTIKTERLTLRNIHEDDKARYYDLVVNDALNKYWGYDYREYRNDLNLDISTYSPDYFYYEVIKDYLSKECLSYMIVAKELIGELVIYNIYNESLEMGVRIFEEYQGKGYASEVLQKMIPFCLGQYKRDIIMKCFIENEKSRTLLEKHLDYDYSDSTYHYFIKRYIYD